MCVMCVKRELEFKKEGYIRRKWVLLFFYRFGWSVGPSSLIMMRWDLGHAHSHALNVVLFVLFFELTNFSRVVFTIKTRDRLIK
jgi:hypothetical protein